MISNKYHYTYCVTEVSTGRMYIGVRSSKVQPSEDIGVKYFTSSFDKEFRQAFKETPENFICEILGVYAHRRQAVRHEIQLHNVCAVNTNQAFINRVKQTSEGYDSTGTVSVKDKNTYTRIPVTEYDKTIHILSLGDQSGSNNNGALKINIYNEKNELMFKCHGNLVSVCKENGMPVRAMYESMERRKRITGNTNKSKGFTNWCAVQEGENIPSLIKPKYTILDGDENIVEHVINLTGYAKTQNVSPSMFLHSFQRGRPIAGQSKDTLKFKNWRVIKYVC